jgi:ribonuclease HI
LLDCVLDATSTEALALLKGLEWLNKLGVSKVIIESDSLELIQVCNVVIEI